MSDLQTLRAQLAELDEKIAAERQTVSSLRRQIDGLRPILPPTTGCNVHPDDLRVTPLRVVLRAHQDALIRTLARRDRVQSDINRLKSGGHS